MDVDSCLINAALHTCGAQDIIGDKGYAPGIPGYSHRIVRCKPLPFRAHTVLLGEVCNVGSIRIAEEPCGKDEGGNLIGEGVSIVAFDAYGVPLGDKCVSGQLTGIDVADIVNKRP